MRSGRCGAYRCPAMSVPDPAVPAPTRPADAAVTAVTGPGRYDGDAIAAVAQLLVDDGTLTDILERVVRLACEAGPAETASVTLQVQGKARLVACTDDLARQLDELQVRLGEGPHLDTLTEGEAFEIPDTSADGRWPAFVAGAAAAGVRSALSLPIGARGRTVGSLNLYATRAGAFDEETRARLAVFARQAAVVLVNAQVYWDARTLSENLQQAMDSRATIDHAIGILMAGGSPSPEEAFQILVRASQRENRKLRDIATDIVARAAQRSARPVDPPSGTPAAEPHEAPAPQPPRH